MKAISKAAVLGSGVMGGTIAAHLANAGIPVLLLDIVPRELSEAERAKNLTLESPAVRNRISTAGLEALKKMKPAAFFVPGNASLVEVGNFDDDMRRLRDCDWVIEVVVENMGVKKKLLGEKVAPNLKPGAVLSTNTSGLSVNELADALPEELRKSFLVTHFFNPPRYMRLLEIVPSRYTDPAVVNDMAAFISGRLGKGIVYGKDTPNFIANRIGVFAMCNAVKHMVDLDMTVEEVDAAAGPATARPRSAVFRTADLVGIDTLVHVADNSYDLLAADEQREVFRFPEFVKGMVAKGLLGNKSKAGFYKKADGPEGPVTLFYDHKSGEYVPPRKPKFESLAAAKIEDPARRVPAVLTGTDKAAQFAWRNLRDTLIYAYRRIPGIADDVVNVDNAMKWGFNWELGPFELLDAIGPKAFVERARADGVDVPEGLAGVERFYAVRDGKPLQWSPATKSYTDVPADPRRVDLAVLKRNGGLVEGNAGASIVALGDGVFCLEFHTKMNAIGDEILTMVHRALARAESEGQGLVIANHGAAFSAGANLALLAGGITERAYEKIRGIVSEFQRATMALKYARVPVVAAPHALALGGGCEVCLHAHAVNPHAETYMGLVEIGVGLLPAGGGTKELAVRAIELAESFDMDVSPFLFKAFTQIATAKVSTSADELRAMGFLRFGDAVTMNLDYLVSDAKAKVLALATNFRPARPRSELKAPGRSIAASMGTQLWNMKMGGFVTEYEEKLGKVIARVLTGGDVPGGTPVSEAWLLELEQEAFVKLCGEPKTLERIEHMLKKGKPLRN